MHPSEIRNLTRAKLAGTWTKRIRSYSTCVSSTQPGN